MFRPKWVAGEYTLCCVGMSFRNMTIPKMFLTVLESCLRRFVAGGAHI